MFNTLILSFLNGVLALGEDSGYSCYIFWSHQPKVPEYFLKNIN